MDEGGLRRSTDVVRMAGARFPSARAADTEPHHTNETVIYHRRMRPWGSVTCHRWARPIARAKDARLLGRVVVSRHGDSLH